MNWRWDEWWFSVNTVLSSEKYFGSPFLEAWVGDALRIYDMESQDASVFSTPKFVLLIIPSPG